MIVKKKWFIVIPFLIVLSISSLFVGFRDFSIGTDTYNYINIYDNAQLSYRDRHELGFYYFTKFFGSIYDNYNFYFFIVCLFVSIFIFLTFAKFIYEKDSNYEKNQNIIISLLIFLMCLFLSDWFYTGVTNTLRHSMALSLVYFSLFYLYKKRILLFLSLIILSTFFHQSTIILLPFFIALFFLINKSSNFYISIFLFFLIFYYLDLNGLFIEKFSSLIGFDLYNTIYYYGDDGLSEALWFGFDFRFVLFNIFWFFFPLILIKFDLLDNNDQILKFFIKVFCVLSIYFFIFGFGGFSNRWAYPSWLFLPIYQAYIFSNIKINMYYKVVIALFSIPSFLYFIFRVI